MTKRHTQTCPVAEFVNIFGDAWTWLIIREAFYGAARFNEIQRNTGIAKNLLSDRLNRLVEEGLLQREDIGASGPRYAYRLTAKGRSLAPVLVAMVQWSNEYIFGAGNEPVRLIEKSTGRQIARLTPQSSEGDTLGWEDVLSQPGPGANRHARLRIAQSIQGISGDQPPN